MSNSSFLIQGVTAMGCVVEFENLRFNFAKNREKQQLLLQILINFDLLNFSQIALILDVPVCMLENVYRGSIFLQHNVSEKLSKLFLLMIGHPADEENGS